MAIELTPAKLAKLRQKAEAAETQGQSPWRFVKIEEEYHTYCEVRDMYGCQVVEDSTQEEAEHIAEADPATVLAMVEEIEQLTKTSQELFDKTKALEQEIEQIKRQAENNVKHVPYYTGKGPLEQAIEILGTRELNKVIQSRKESEATQ